MTNIVIKPGTSSSTARSDLSTPPFAFSIDCSTFLNWDEEELDSEHEQAVIFQSLVATVQLKPSLDVSLETKVVKCLNQVITTAAMNLLNHLIRFCKSKIRLALVKADLIPQLNNILNPQSLSFAETVYIHIHLMSSIATSVRLATPIVLANLGIEDGNEQQAVHETVLKHVLVPSEEYVCHLCVNIFSLTSGPLSEAYETLLAQILRISPYYQPTMDFVLRMPIVLTIPSCLIVPGQTR
ncbi:hypothetical protein BLNAU_11091 [Blattamonas nauphoetae]|uniref:Uncharacterized protein n=1 Tax=Blattamonas nauphoetae TaxID=2049346 RepID=A0ABQ9XQG6_9EUKA|nr:hypothetical protein BLNAU_11091 [Blattamonas nauphoetae]